MAFNYKAIQQVKEAAAKLIKQAAPPVFPPEGPNPASVNAPKPAPTSVDKAIASSRVPPTSGPTSADLAIQANRRQQALGRGQLVTGLKPGASMAAPDYATARALEDFTRSENVRNSMRDAGSYLANAASGAANFGRSAIDNAATIKKHVEHARSSPLGYLASLGQNSGSPMLDRMGTALIDPEAFQNPVGVAAGGRNIMPNEYANYQQGRSAQGQRNIASSRPSSVFPPVQTPFSTSPSKLNVDMPGVARNR